MSYFIRGSQERAARMLGRVCFIRKWMSVSLNEREYNEGSMTEDAASF